mgnify:CR=1 FL=1
MQSPRSAAAVSLPLLQRSGLSASHPDPVASLETTDGLSSSPSHLLSSVSTPRQEYCWSGVDAAEAPQFSHAHPSTALMLHSIAGTSFPLRSFDGKLVAWKVSLPSPLVDPVRGKRLIPAPRFFSAGVSAAVIASTTHASKEAGTPSSMPSMYAARHLPARFSPTRAVTLTIRFKPDLGHHHPSLGAARRSVHALPP